MFSCFVFPSFSWMFEIFKILSHLTWGLESSWGETSYAVEDVSHPTKVFELQLHTQYLKVTHRLGVSLIIFGMWQTSRLLHESMERLCTRTKNYSLPSSQVDVKFRLLPPRRPDRLWFHKPKPTAKRKEYMAAWRCRKHGCWSGAGDSECCRSSSLARRVEIWQAVQSIRKASVSAGSCLHSLTVWELTPSKSAGTFFFWR